MPDRQRTTAPDEPAEAEAPVEAAAAGDRRLAQIFRGWLRDGHVHPLLHAMRRYRGDGGDE